MRFHLKPLITLCLLLCSLVAYSEDSLHISLGDNYGKHAMVINGEPEGIQKDLLTWFLIEHMELDVNIEAMPWKRAQKLVVETKASDGYFTAYTRKRVGELKLVPSEKPFYSTRVKMHTWKDNPKIERFRKLKDVNELIKDESIKHVIIGGHGYHEELFKDAKFVHRLVSPHQVPQYLLLYKRADLFIEQSELFYPLVEDEGLMNSLVTLDGIDFKSLHWHLYIRPDSKHVGLMVKINQELDRVIKSGLLLSKVQQIFSNYGLSYTDVQD